MAACPRCNGALEVRLNSRLECLNPVCFWSADRWDARNLEAQEPLWWQNYDQQVSEVLRKMPEYPVGGSGMPRRGQ